MKRTLMAASLAIVISANIICSPANAVSLMTNVNCADWAKHRNDMNTISALMEGVLIGTLNGLSLASGDEFWEGLDPDQAFFWMDRYCDKNPLAYMWQGATTLMDERTGTR